MKKTILIGLLLLMAAAPAAAEVVSKIAAVVNDEIITTHQLDLKVTEFMASQAQGQIISSERMEALRKQFLDRLIEETLVKQKVRELKITASDQELEDAIGDVLRQNQITREQLVVAVESQGMKFDDYKEKLRDQILRFKLIGHEVQSKVEVTNQEVLDYFREHIDDYREPPFVQLSNLMFPIPNKAPAEQVEALRQKAAATLERLRQGEDFAAIEIELEAAGLASGEDMGRFKEDDLSSFIRNALKGVEAGAYTEVVENPSALMIFRVDDKAPGKIRKFDEVKVEIREKLSDLDRDERFQKWSGELRKKAFIDIRI